ncbi:AI-2E family transporter [Emcibacter sp.]|uniref:AI-2E family transporter n=1 Tax=Emcibacter sp. TaxID=1979954 RepID=UPI003A8C9257
MNYAEQRNTYLGLICIVVAFLVVHWLKPVLMPLVVALFMITVAWPINNLLKSVFPKHVSHVLSYAALGAILAAFGGVVYLAISQFTGQISGYQEQILALIKQGREFMDDAGLPVPDEVQADQLQGIFAPVMDVFYSSLGHWVLITGLVLLGLPEMVYWEDKLKNCLGERNGNKWLDAAEEAATSFQKYMIVMTLIGFFAAAMTTLFCWAVGLDFALLWGLMAFVMNFIPVLGSMFMLLPPTLMAFLQFTDPDQVLLVFSGMAIIQFIMGNVIDPHFQGKFLSMSPVVILLSIAFWGFLWGVPGAFLAVPLTHIFMITCYQFPSTRAIACLLSEGEGTSLA